jgi:phosphoadenosine phosphosulfate reductase
MQNELKLKELEKQLRDKSAEESLKIVAVNFSGKIIYTTSFGIEDQVITHMIFSNAIDIDVATLDTGRLFPETYKVFNETIKKYNKKIKVYFPDNARVEKMVTEKGPFSFYYSQGNRHECCGIRKTEPLKRALEGRECWIAGIRADQSDNRKQMSHLEFDTTRNVIKFYPLFNWSVEDVMEYIGKNKIPYNILHEKGYVSIGCEPCTRAVKPGEDFRAGRWWWEKGSEKECGLHK